MENTVHAPNNNNDDSETVWPQGFVMGIVALYATFYIDSTPRGAV